MNCITCHEPIAAARLAAVPSATQCVACKSKRDDKPTRGYMSWEHKTAPALIIGADADKLRRYDRRGFHAQLPFTPAERDSE